MVVPKAQTESSQTAINLDVEYGYLMLNNGNRGSINQSLIKTPNIQPSLI